MLSKAVPGVPGEDYPIYSEVPDTGFSCEGQVDGGYYADPEAECQVFHICTADGQGGLAKYSFLCPNGTVFNQNYFICDWWFNFDCAEAEGLYSINEDIAAERAAADGAADAPASYGAPEAAGDSYSAGAGSDYNYDAAPAPAEYDDAAYADYEEEAQPTYEGESAAPSYGVPEEAAPPTEAPLNSYEAERGARAFRGNNRSNRNRSQGRRQGRRNNGRRNNRRGNNRQGRRFRG